MVERRAGLDASLAICLLGAPLLAHAGSDGSVEAESPLCAASNSWPSVTADGRCVVFASSESQLVAEDTNGFADVFVHDAESGETTLVSVATGGARSNGNSFHPSISADGRYVAFWSDASNLDSFDTNGATDLFIHDRRCGATERVSELLLRSLRANDLDPSRAIESSVAALRSEAAIHAWAWADVFDDAPSALELLRRSESVREGSETPPRSGPIAVPGDFELTDPLDFAGWVGHSTTEIPFTWTASTDLDGYTLEITEDFSFASVDISIPVAAGTTTHDFDATTLQFPQVYYWRVRATNVAGTTVASNAPFRFELMAPGSSHGSDDSMLFCFVATAAYGSPMEPEVRTLREFRDRVLLPTAPGRAFVGWYYRTSPPFAAAIAEHPLRRSVARAVLWPAVGFASAILWTGEHPVRAFLLAALLFAAASYATWFVRSRRAGQPQR